MLAMAMTAADVQANIVLNDPTYPYNLAPKFERCGLDVFQEHAKVRERWHAKLQQLPGYNNELLDEDRFRFLSIPYMRHNGARPAVTHIMWVNVDGIWRKVRSGPLPVVNHRLTCGVNTATATLHFVTAASLRRSGLATFPTCTRRA